MIKERIARAIDAARNALGLLGVAHKLAALAVALITPLAIVGVASWRAADMEIAVHQRQLDAAALSESIWRVSTDIAQAPAGDLLGPSLATGSADAFVAATARHGATLGVAREARLLRAALDAERRAEGGDRSAARAALLARATRLLGALGDTSSSGLAQDGDASKAMTALARVLPRYLLAAQDLRDAAARMPARGGPPAAAHAPSAPAPETASTNALVRALGALDATRADALDAAGRIASPRAIDADPDLAHSLAAFTSASARLRAQGEALAARGDRAAPDAAGARTAFDQADQDALAAADRLWRDLAAHARARLTERADALSATRRAWAAIALILAGLAGVCAVALARSIVSPQRALAQAAAALVGGDVRAPAPLSGRKDEIGDIARALEGFRQSLIDRARLEDKLETERTALEARIAERTHDLQAANVAKSRFVALLSHEIRTPLNGVLGMASALSRTSLDAEQTEMLRVITASGDVLLRLLNNAIDITRIEAGQFELDVAPFDLAEMVDFAASLYRPSALAKGLWFDVAVAPEAKGGYRGDVVRLRQILQNFVSNAVKFTERGGIAVSVTKAGARDGRALLRFDVADTGVGLPANAERLFQRFTQGELSRRHGGAGLGLAICRELANLMGGEVSAHARVGAGAMFRLEVALEPAALGARATSARDDPHAPLAGVKVLAADDNAMNRLVLKTLCAQAGLDIQIVEDGSDAVEAARAYAFDIILMDVHMPRLDGLTATQAIRMIAGPNQHTPILALTADAMPAQVQACLAAGMNGHIAKPIQIESLFAALADALAQRRQTGQGVAAAR